MPRNKHTKTIVVVVSLKYVIEKRTYLSMNTKLQGYEFQCFTVGYLVPTHSIYDTSIINL